MRGNIAQCTSKSNYESELKRMSFVRSFLRRRIFGHDCWWHEQTLLLGRTAEFGDEATSQDHAQNYHFAQPTSTVQKQFIRGVVRSMFKGMFKCIPFLSARCLSLIYARMLGWENAQAHRRALSSVDTCNVC